MLQNRITQSKATYCIKGKGSRPQGDASGMGGWREPFVKTIAKRHKRPGKKLIYRQGQFDEVTSERKLEEVKEDQFFFFFFVKRK